MAHSTRTASLIVMLAAATPLYAQSNGRPRFDAAVVHTTNLVEDANGTSVTYGLAPALGAGYAWTLSPGTNAALGARVSRAGVDINYVSGSQSAGSGWVVDVRAVLEREIGPCAAAMRGCAAVHAGGGATWASGPDDVAPFSTDRGAMLTGEVGAAVRVAGGRPVYVTGAAQAFRLGGATAGDPIRETGTVMRFLVGVRHGR
jgi:hypothetical protein